MCRPKSVQGWSNGAKTQNPKKSLDQKLTPKKSHVEFLSLKNLQKGKQVWLTLALIAELGGLDLWTLSRIFRLFWITRKKSLLKSSHQKKKNTCKKPPKISPTPPREKPLIRWSCLGLSTSCAATFWQLLVFRAFFFVSSNFLHSVQSSLVFYQFPPLGMGQIMGARCMQPGC